MLLLLGISWEISRHECQSNLQTSLGDVILPFCFLNIWANREIQRLVPHFSLNQHGIIPARLLTTPWHVFHINYLAIILQIMSELFVFLILKCHMSFWISGDLFCSAPQIPGQLWYRHMTWNQKTWPCPNSSGMRDTPLKVVNSLVFTGMSTIPLLAVYKNCGLPVWVFPPLELSFRQRQPGVAHPSWDGSCLCSSTTPTRVPTVGTPPRAQRKEVGTYQRWLTLDEYNQFSMIHSEHTLEFSTPKEDIVRLFSIQWSLTYYIIVQSKSF